jgi:hypothetical protein
MVRRVAAGLIAFFLLLGCNTVTRLATPPTLTTSPESSDAEYAVYSALIDAMFLTDKLNLIVIEDHTGWGLGSDEAQELAYIRKSLPEVDQQLLDDFKAKNAQSGLLEDRFSLKAAVKLISQEEVSRCFAQGGGAWDEFYKQYPNSQGLMTLSKVGFNAAGDKALVYMGNQSHFLAGAGYAVVLAKKDGVWKILNQVMLWVS